MAKKSDTTRKNDAADPKPASIRYDDFVGKVHADPAKPEAAVMLAGFIGHGGEGEVRIYTDASLGTWYDVPEADVVHAVPMTDTKLGGSYVWVRASAAIKPGSATAITGAGAAAAPVGGWPPSLGCQPSFMACRPAALFGAPAQDTQKTSGPDCAPYVTNATCCTVCGCTPAVHAQTNPPTLGCSGGCNVVGAAQTFTMGLPCNHAAVVGAGTMTGFFGCTAACPPAAAVGAGAMTGFFGCTAACPPAAAVGAGTMTGFFGCTAACPPAAAMGGGGAPRGGVFTPHGG
jgi:hypothetical protein